MGRYFTLRRVRRPAKAACVTLMRETWMICAQRHGAVDK